MRVLITTDTVGGVWRFTQELAAGLLETDCRVALVSFGALPSAAQRGDCARLESTWGEAFRYTASDLPLEWMQRNEQCFESGTEVISRIAQQFAPDILHSNQYCFGALELGIPTIVTAHSDVMSWARACRDGVLENSPWIARYRGLVQTGLNGANAVTAPSRWMLRALCQGFKVSSETSVIPHISTGPRRVQAVTAGRLWDEAKDVMLLEQVSSRIPLIVAGERECQGFSVPQIGGVKLVGALAESELLQLFHESAVYLCTSRYEPFGLAPLEAAMCGCALVVRRIESLEETWGDAALYFRDAESLSELLAWLYEDRESLRKAQQRASDRAGLYTREAMVTAYRALYFAVTEMAGVS